MPPRVIDIKNSWGSLVELRLLHYDSRLQARFPKDRMKWGAPFSAKMARQIQVVVPAFREELATVASPLYSI